MGIRHRSIGMIIAWISGRLRPGLRSNAARRHLSKFISKLVAWWTRRSTTTGMTWSGKTLPIHQGADCGDEERSPLVSGTDEFGEHPGFGLILGKVGEVVESR